VAHDTENRGRLRHFVTYVLLRPLLFIFWSLVLWGTWALLAFLWALLAHGPAEALARIGPRGRGAWGNAVVAALAAVTWLIALAAWWGRRPRTRR
jgi:hypothetical protein